MLDPADYGPVIINKSVSITGVPGAGINSTPAGGTSISINAGQSDTINISNLILDGLKIATVGLDLQSGGSIAITHCIVRNFSGAGNPFGIKLKLIRPL